jgi:arsenate reductase
MGEALNELGNDQFLAESAGLESGTLNPNVVLAMNEVGIDISQNKTKSTDDMIYLGKFYDYVITVCDEASDQCCPIF